mmetsp:Transcript_12594/g.26669  ORF Transcript_12594/g.26669 Transcript_12594/m.26669 type:complete len:162 (+) Transcript_12594:1079-1564(+)
MDSSSSTRTTHCSFLFRKLSSSSAVAAGFVVGVVVSPLVADRRGALGCRKRNEGFRCPPVVGVVPNSWKRCAAAAPGRVSATNETKLAVVAAVPETITSVPRKHTHVQTTNAAIVGVAWYSDDCYLPLAAAAAAMYNATTNEISYFYETNISCGLVRSDLE